MFQTKYIDQKKINNNPYLFINLVFAFFPISLILGTFIVGINLLLFCCLGAYYLRSKILNHQYDFPIKIIFFFFILIFFSTSLGFVKILYLQGYDGINLVPACDRTNCLSPLARLTKSIVFFSYFLFLIIIYLLNKYSILNYRYFFLIAALASILLSLDIIYQFFFGFDIIGLKSSGFINSGFFGDEYVAGGYLQRFALFAIFFMLFVFKNNNYTKLISTAAVISILGIGIFFSGSRMPVVLFVFGLMLTLLFNIKIKKILILSLITMFIFFKFTIFPNELYKRHLERSYDSFVGQAKTMINITGIQKWNKTYWLWEENSFEEDQITDQAQSIGKNQSPKQRTFFYEVEAQGLHKRIYLAAIDTWKNNKIFGNGIKSFREDCWRLSKRSDTYLGELPLPGKKNRLCSNHPHNYYLEILTETGIIGLFSVFIMALLFIVFIFKNLNLAKKNNIENYILLSAIISLILEAFPLRSSGSFFTTNNITYLILISSIVLSYKTLIKTNDSK